MKSEANIHLFIIQNSVIEKNIRKFAPQSPDEVEFSEVEKSAEKLIEKYIPQFDSDNQKSAVRMAYYYRLFYMLENDIRNLIVSTLSEGNETDWWDQNVPQLVRENANKAKDRELSEGVTPRSEDMIFYSNFGDLGEIIKYKWDLFAGIFSGGSLNGVLSVLRRLNTLRGPIAHCGELNEDEVVRLKLTIRDWFRLME